ncbi:hypothetical protein [Sphingobacterium sp. CZ-2]|uniref:hypothetical protein n=1 Tax=Sphingobacterium sp. CZ-2 TaxID=2557994 RepID=UPI00106F4652|nr:hypothetical protein [Sphingobacterium sp. CZ-2]QBR13234.1 hypothetical protein E3D81_14100 [Sphingobacterium sp. CZ-2]
MKLLKITGIFLLMTSCATYMSPTEISNTLPSLTKATFYSSIDAAEAVKTSNCRVLVENRKYLAPVGLTRIGDLRNGARGIDEWVRLDGGNAYSLKSYQWQTVNDKGESQLQLEFTTMVCE